MFLFWECKGCKKPSPAFKWHSQDRDAWWLHNDPLLDDERFSCPSCTEIDTYKNLKTTETYGE